MTADSQGMNVRETLLRERIDPCLTAGNLSALASAALGVRTRCRDHAVLTGGCWNGVISVSTHGGHTPLVFKITPDREDAGLRREWEVLRYFKARTSLPVPEPLLLDLQGERIPGSVLVMEKAPGAVLLEARRRLKSRDTEILSDEIAEHLADLHSRRETGFGGVEIPMEERAATWPDFWLPRFEEAVAETTEKGYMPEDLLSEIDAARRHLPRLLEIGPRGTLTHYDIWNGNVMVAYRAGRPCVSAFLDPSGYFADYARELSAMFSLADPRFMQAYGRLHGFDERFEARFGIYSMKMCLQMVCMYPSEPRHLECARQHLGRVQACLRRHVTS